MRYGRQFGAIEDNPFYTGDGADTFIGPPPPPTDYATPEEIAAATAGGSQAVPGQTPGVPGGNYSAGQLSTIDSLVGTLPGLPPGPAPRVNVPLTASSAGMYLTNSTIVSGVPNWLAIAGFVLGASLLGNMFAGKRRR